jgi:LmbE family N-acetylglucosaminyl deacetylase
MLDGTYREHDDILLPDRESIDEFADVIGDVRPDIIITHHPQDSVVAHSATGQMALLTMEAAHGMRAGKPYLSHKVKQVYYNVLLGQATVLENAIPRIPTTVIDITDVVPKKDRGMNRYLAQYYDDDSPLHRKVGEVFDAPLAGIQY